MKTVSKIGTVKMKIGVGLLMLLGSAMANASGIVIAGSNNSSITVEEYADFECHYCMLGSGVMQQILNDYQGKIKLVFHTVPLHEGSLTAAKAFLAVALQGETLAYTYQKELFANQAKLDNGDAILYELAEKIGVDISRMKTDMSSDAIAKSIADDKQEFAAHGFHGTPSFLVGTEAIEGTRSYDVFKKSIDAQLAGK